MCEMHYHATAACSHWRNLTSENRLAEVKCTAKFGQFLNFPYYVLYMQKFDSLACWPRTLQHFSDIKLEGMAEPNEVSMETVTGAADIGDMYLVIVTERIAFALPASC